MTDLTPEYRQLLQQALDAYSVHQSELKASADLKISRGTLQQRLRRARQLGFTPTKGLDKHGSPKVLVEKIKRLEAELKASSQRSTDMDITRNIDLLSSVRKETGSTAISQQSGTLEVGYVFKGDSFTHIGTSCMSCRM